MLIPSSSAFNWLVITGKICSFIFWATLGPDRQKIVARWHRIRLGIRRIVHATVAFSAKILGHINTCELSISNP